MANVDFTNVETKDFELLPRGEYPLRVVEAEERDSQSSEYQYLNLSFEVIDGDFAGRRVWDNPSYSPKALWKLKDFLAAAGYTEEDLSGAFEFDPADLVGVEVVGRVIQKKDNYNGEDRLKNVVNSYTPA